MEYLLFVLWMILYPISCSVVSYLDVKTRQLNNDQPPSDFAETMATLTQIIIYVSVAVLLYNAVEVKPN